MREAMGQALLFQIIIIFIAVIMFIFLSSVSYSKAYRVKNRIVNIIEENNGYNANVKSEIEQILSEIGYTVSNNVTNCQERTGATAVYPSSYNNKGYNYCIVKYEDSKGRPYYGVTTFMKFEFPIIGEVLEFPVYGETKTFGILD